MFATTGEHSVGADIVGLRVVSTRLGLASLDRAGSTSGWGTALSLIHI